MLHLFSPTGKGLPEESDVGSHSQTMTDTTSNSNPGDGNSDHRLQGRRTVLMAASKSSLASFHATLSTWRPAHLQNVQLEDTERN